MQLWKDPFSSEEVGISSHACEVEF